MVYPAISSRRMPYDIDGTALAYGSITEGIVDWFTPTEKAELNNDDYNSFMKGAKNNRIFVFFPEKREIEAIYVISSTSRSDGTSQQMNGIWGSVDSTNGLDGTWEAGVMSGGYPVHENNFSWRSGIKTVSFSGPIKVLQIGLPADIVFDTIYKIMHLYGRKAAGETPDDIQFCNTSTGTEKTALMDWGDRPEGTTLIDSFKAKNASASKIANNVNLQLNHSDFLLSWSPDGPWTATLDIATLGVGALSNTVYVRNKLEPPLLILGPYAARVIASVGSWT